MASSSCPAYGSTSEVSLWYAIDDDPDVAIEAVDTFIWYPVAMTGESLTANLSSSPSEQITPNRSYAGSKLSQGEISGAINFECQASEFLYDMLICVLQSNKDLSVASGMPIWEDTEAITNGNTKKCLTFLKLVKVGNNSYDQFIFRGVQVGSMNFDISPGTLITGSANLMGIKPQDPIEAAELPVAWTFADAQSLPLMAGVDSLKNFAIKDSSGVDTGVVLQSLTINLDNQLRQQTAVGIDSIYAAGIGSGRFIATYSGRAYYSNPKIYNEFISDASLSVEGQILDFEGFGFYFLSSSVKITSGAIPTADSADQDLMVSSEFRAFEDVTDGTLKITRTSLVLELYTLDGVFLATENNTLIGVAA
jgi:hypothetical protein